MEIRYSTRFNGDDEFLTKILIGTGIIDIIPENGNSHVIIWDSYGNSKSVYLESNVIDITSNYIILGKDLKPNVVITNAGYSGFIIPQVNWIRDDTL